MRRKPNIQRPGGLSREVLLELRALGNAYATGVINQDALLEALRELQQTSIRQTIRRFHTRGVWAALSGLLPLVAWDSGYYLFPDVAELAGGWWEVLPFAAILSLLGSAFFFVRYFRRLDEHAEWFEDLKNSLLGRGSMDAFLDGHGQPTFVDPHEA